VHVEDVIVTQQNATL